MEKIQKKLKNKNGATAIMALVYLLLCVTIGGIILSASSTAMGQVIHLRSEEQAYLTVFSAAELIKTQMKDASYIEKYITISHSRACDVNEPSPQTEVTYPANELSSRLQTIYDNPGIEENFVIEASEIGIQNVNATVSINAEFALKFVLTEQSSTLYTMTLLMPADVQVSYTTESQTHEYESPLDSGIFIMCTRNYSCDTTTVIYDKGIIYKGAN